MTEKKQEPALFIVSASKRTTAREVQRVKDNLQRQLGPTFKPVVVPNGFALAGIEPGTMVTAGTAHARARREVKRIQEDDPAT